MSAHVLLILLNEFFIKRLRVKLCAFLCGKSLWFKLSALMCGNPLFWEILCLTAYYISREWHLKWLLFDYVLMLSY